MPSGKGGKRGAWIFFTWDQIDKLTLLTGEMSSHTKIHLDDEDRTVCWAAYCQFHQNLLLPPKRLS